MRILQINSAKNWGGGEAHTHLVYKGLIKRGFDVTLACRPNSAIANVFAQEGHKTVHFGLKNALDIGSGYKMAQFCSQNNITMIHAHLGRDYWLAAWAKLFYPSVHVVFTRHVLIPLKKSMFHRWLFSQASKIIAVSKVVEETVIDSNLVGKEKIITIYNGIDIEKFSTAPVGRLRGEIDADSHTKLIGIIGQVSPHKGQDVLIKCLPLILQSRNDVRCVIIGGDFRNGTYIDELKKLATDLGVGEKVDFLGQRNDIQELLKDIDVFVLASQMEPFGLVVAEAMAAAVPVVATRFGGAAELVEDGITGLLVSYGDIEAMTSAIINLLDGNVRESIIKEASVKVNSMCSQEKMIRDLIKVYHEINDSLHKE